jgi:hypothetical protein
MAAGGQRARFQVHLLGVNADGDVTARARSLTTVVGAVAVVSLAAGLLSGCGGGSTRARSLVGLDQRVNPSRPPLPGATAPVPATTPDPAGLSGEIGLPNGSANELTFYFSLPTDDYTLREAAKALTTPGTGSYRHYFTSYADAARAYGAKPADIEAADRPLAPPQDVRVIKNTRYSGKIEHPHPGGAARHGQAAAPPKS